MFYQGFLRQMRSSKGIFSGLLALAGTLMLAEIASGKDMKGSGARQESGDMWRSSFSKPEAFVDNAEPESMKGRKDTVEVPSINSFPLRVQVDESDVNGWDQPENVTEPRKIDKAFRISNCQFHIVGGDFSVRRYKSDVPGQAWVEADAVMPQSTFPVAIGEPILFSLTTSLTVRVDEKFAQICKETFAGRRLSIGYASLAGSEFYGVGEQGDAAPANTFRQEVPTRLFVMWDAEAGRLTLADQIGMVPEIESHIYSLRFDERDAYYLGFEPELRIVREKTKLAGK
jgi:hypothetical protein